MLQIAGMRLLLLHARFLYDQLSEVIKRRWSLASPSNDK
jgi:hypothetical protein